MTTFQGLSRPGSSLLSFLVTCFVIILFFSPSTEASISIVETGRTFESKPDRAVGQRLWKGYEYLGRLQFVSENPTLCSTTDPSKNDFINIVPTADGLPVALLVRSGGGCTVAEKARVASKMIKPSNLVQYLITIDEHKRRPDSHLTDPRQQQPQQQIGEEEFDNIHGIASRETALMGFVDEHLGTRERGTVLADWFAPAIEENDTFKGVATITSPGLNDSESNNNDDQISVAILHVTQATGDELLDIIFKEASQVRASGGTKILLNSRVSMVSFRTVLMWLLTTLIMCSCACCSMLLFMQSTVEEEQPQAPPRPVRRRLTLDQVRTRFPAFFYNPDDESQNHRHQQQQEALLDSGKETAAVMGDQHKYNHLMDECTICLDEFSPGDRCRKLPCGHVFHSPCIARWLIERSAVCPLCKFDLFEEEEEEEEEEQDETEGAAVESPPAFDTRSLFPWWSNFATTTTSVTFGPGRRSIEIPSGAAAATVPAATITTSEPATEIPTGNGSTTVGGGVSQPTESIRSWWPFSLEQQQHVHSAGTVGDGEEGIERSALAPSRWRLNWFGQRRRRHTMDGDNNMITELTEPLMTGDRDGQIHQENNSHEATIPSLQLQYVVPVHGQEQTGASATTNSDVPSLSDSSNVPPTAAEI